MGLYAGSLTLLARSFPQVKKKKKKKIEKNESARARNSGSEAHEKWALRRAIPFYLVLN